MKSESPKVIQSKNRTIAMEAKQLKVEELQKSVLSVGTLVGKLSSAAMEKECEEWKKAAKPIAEKVLSICCEVCDALNVSLDALVMNKMKINCFKYPSGKDKYTGKGDITKWHERSDNGFLDKQTDFSSELLQDSTIPGSKSANKEALSERLDRLKEHVTLFVDDRGLKDMYTPFSLSMSLMAEAGELAEVVQWTDRSTLLDHPMFTTGGKKYCQICEEVSDVSIYCLHILRL